VSKDKQAAEAVIETAKQKTQKKDDILTLSTGIRVRLRPVSASLIADVQARFTYPDPPLVMVESKGREEPNVNDPHWQRKCGEIDTARGQAAMDAFCMFGMELVEGVPSENDWITRLNLIGVEFDAADAIAKEFYYKKYVAVGGVDDLQLISQSSLDPEGSRPKRAVSQ
jgi:hypothetical protein